MTEDEKNNENNLARAQIFGKKVFFINPAYSIRQDVIPRLQDKEFEIYIIDSYKDAKNVLRLHESSVCFINVDAQLSIDAWFNFIKSFEKEMTLRSVFVGIISERIRREDRSIFLSEANIPGGIITVDESTDAITTEIENILVECNAKGMRQYVRAKITNERDAQMFWTSDDKLFQMKLLDISSVGMCVKVPAQMINLAQKNTVLRDLTLRIGPKQYVVDAIVFAIKPDVDGINWILLLHPNTPAQVKTAIRAYVSETIQKQMMVSINNKAEDTTDYNGIPYYKLVSGRKKSS
ncbi:hypothetical protein DYE49_09915 [Treponema rectale]|uniref:PilZ domain-containing protein n=1 Tax=Treponema rectale TaxID=744512 RepID=A0A840SJ03_9SPIR|nr:hypothetical protein [Treponema rectale]MBB5219371.1 hypothetical protein [Treponema rectale]QOS40745.1 hypothetical protein DYE49_09915 [Treponema rectale]